MTAHRVYRSLTLLYPKDFRDRYRDDLIQHHGDLFSDRGAAAAWARTGLDLLITIPRYRLESTMDNDHANTVLYLMILAFGIVGAATFIAGISVGAVLLALALIVAIAQRSPIARSLRNPGPRQRNRRLLAALILAAFAMGVLAIAFNDDEWGDTGAIVYNIAFLSFAIGSIGFLVAGLLTSRHASHRVVEAG